MTWRIIDVSSNSKLDLKLNYMVVRNGEGIRRVYIPEMAVLVLESTAISITAALLCELTRQEVKIVFCDEKRNPYGELTPYYGTGDCVKKSRIQTSWSDRSKGLVWAEIVKQKILNQSMVLRHTGHPEESNMLEKYAKEVELGDITNREGHAAKVYFNTLFDEGFSRREDCSINSALNYGYAILLSSINRSISAFGYSLLFGIFHDSGTNPFNLGCDLMEPFRPVVDLHVHSMWPVSFESEQKRELLDVLNDVVEIDEKRNYVTNALRIFTQSFFTAMESEDETLLKFPRMIFDEATVHESNGIL